MNISHPKGAGFMPAPSFCARKALQGAGAFYITLSDAVQPLTVFFIISHFFYLCDIILTGILESVKFYASPVAGGKSLIIAAYYGVKCASGLSGQKSAQ